MQDEVNTKVVAIMIKGGKISAEVLKKALTSSCRRLRRRRSRCSSQKAIAASSPSSI